jgi:transcriptional regulator with XRE-family HTH domain
MSKRTILGAAVKAIRCSKAETDPAFTASQFASRCLMSPAHLCNIEAGRKYPPEEVIRRIAAHLGVPVGAISFIGDKSIQVAA